MGKDNEKIGEGEKPEKEGGGGGVREGNDNRKL